MKLLKYIELKSGYADNGSAWIGYVTPSKTGRTLYFNGRGLMKLKGQRRGESGGNYTDMETGESFWISGVKKNGEDRHWAGIRKSSGRSCGSLRFSKGNRCQSFGPVAMRSHEFHPSD